MRKSQVLLAEAGEARVLLPVLGQPEGRGVHRRRCRLAPLSGELWFTAGLLPSEKPAQPPDTERIAGDDELEQGGASFEELKAGELCTGLLSPVWDKGADVLGR